VFRVWGAARERRVAAVRPLLAALDADAGPQA
jgi:hypothetical protein